MRFDRSRTAAMCFAFAAATGAMAQPIDNFAGQPGFFAPSPSEAVVVPPFMPSTPTRATIGASPADTALRDGVAAALAADPELEGARINVLVRDGVVTLSGSAQDRAQAERARALTERMAGFSRVSASIFSPG